MYEGNNGRRGIKGGNMKHGNIRKILFITLSNIGDVILTLPVLSCLRDNFPGADIDVMVGPRPREVFAKDPRINRIFTYDKHANLREKTDFIKRLKNEHYDLAVDMRSSLIPLLIGAKNRTRLLSLNSSRDRHRRKKHLNKLKGLDLDCRGHSNIYIDAKDRELAGRLLEGKGVGSGETLIGVSPACRSRLKEWRVTGFIEVINGLLSKGDYKVVLIGDEHEREVSGEIVDALRHKDLIDLTGATTLGELFALIERMSVILTCDSACMHIACDLGVKVVAIFGPTDPEEYGPTGKGDVVIRKTLECSPCNKAICSLNHECMAGIDPQEVLDAVTRLALR